MNSTKNKLTLTLPSDCEIQMTRDFDAPRDLVFEVMTQPEHVRKWWGCEASQMPVCDIDLRVGGAYRYVMIAPDGNEYAFKGEYLEIARPERLVFTQAFDVEPFQDKYATITTTLEDIGGRTRMTELMRHASKEDRDFVISTGMESGAAVALDRMESVAMELASQ